MLNSELPPCRAFSLYTFHPKTTMEKKAKRCGRNPAALSLEKAISRAACADCQQIREAGSIWPRNETDA